MLDQRFGHALADVEGRFTQVDQTLCGLLGFQRHELLQRSIHDITHPEDWASNGPLLERLKTRDESFTIVKRYLRADGSIIWVQNYVSMLRDDQGRGMISALIRPVLPQMTMEGQRVGARPVSRLATPRPPILDWQDVPPGEVLH
ncbi:PAS domain S-box protein [Roseomonas sp. WA12]